MTIRYPLRWIPQITAEKIDRARNDLELGDSATLADIRRAYRLGARRCHPTNHCRIADLKRITAAWNHLHYYVRKYKYSLREEDIRQDQEPWDIRWERLYGGDLYPEGYARPERFLDDPEVSDLRLTAENVHLARKTLCLGETVTMDDLTRSYRRRAEGCISAVGTSRRTLCRILARCHRLLEELIAGYRYSFRGDTVRRDQEDFLETHRRQYGNYPFWAGGTYDVPD